MQHAAMQAVRFQSYAINSSSSLGCNCTLRSSKRPFQRERKGGAASIVHLREERRSNLKNEIPVIIRSIDADGWL
jgi:hypothetical protein